MNIRPDGVIGRGVNDPFRDRLGWLDLVASGNLGATVQCSYCDGSGGQLTGDVSFTDIPFSIEITEASLLTFQLFRF